MSLKKPPPLRTRTYDWVGWFKRSKASTAAVDKNHGWIGLKPIRDFNGMAHAFAVLLRRNANRRGHSVQTRQTPDGWLHFRVNGKLKAGADGRRK